MRKFILIGGGFCVGSIWANGGQANYVKDFQAYDLDKNGLIDPQEVRTVYGMDGSLSEEELHSFWAAVDPNSQGFFNLEDFVDYAVRHSQISEDDDHMEV